jgi:hypothetical protein
MIGGNDQASVCRNVFDTFVFKMPEDATEKSDYRARQIQDPLW